MKWKIVFVLSLLSHQQKVDCLWYETFQTCLRGDAYSTQFQVRVWKSWVENKSLMIRCVNSAEYLKKHGQELTAKVFSSLDVSEKEEMKTDFVGTSMDNFRCLLQFPPKEKTIGEIMKLLSGFGKIGFFNVGPSVSKGTTKQTDVEIQFRIGSYKFRMELDLNTGQIGIHDMQNTKPPYLDKRDGGKITSQGCFCKLDRIIKKVCKVFFSTSIPQIYFWS